MKELFYKDDDKVYWHFGRLIKRRIVCQRRSVSSHLLLISTIVIEVLSEQCRQTGNYRVITTLLRGNQWLHYFYGAIVGGVVKETNQSNVVRKLHHEVQLIWPTVNTGQEKVVALHIWNESQTLFLKMLDIWNILTEIKLEWNENLSDDYMMSTTKSAPYLYNFGYFCPQFFL